jgi:hypothetical protein
LKVKPGYFASELAPRDWSPSEKFTNWNCTSGSSLPGSTRANRLASDAPTAIWFLRRRNQPRPSPAARTGFAMISFSVPHGLVRKA